MTGYAEPLSQGLEGSIQSVSTLRLLSHPYCSFRWEHRVIVRPPTSSLGTHEVRWWRNVVEGSIPPLIDEMRLPHFLYNILNNRFL